jgi:tetrahydromethanopterin S-methyltransferase subunit B
LWTSNPVTHTVIPDMQLTAVPSTTVVGEAVEFIVTHSGVPVDDYLLDTGEIEINYPANLVVQGTPPPTELRTNPDPQYANAGIYTAVVTGTYLGQPFTATTVVTVTSGFTITKDASPTPGSVVGTGENINYTVVVTWDGGSGAAPATGLVITDTYDPGELSVNNATATPVASTTVTRDDVNGVITVTVTPIEANPANPPVITLNVDATVVATQPGIIENTADASYNDRSVQLHRQLRGNPRSTTAGAGDQQGGGTADRYGHSPG